MKNILKLKFKAHVLLNYIFYFLIFIVGFVIGTITKKVNINEIISKFLMIDNVSALTIADIDNLSIDEEFIYDNMFDNTSYNINDFPYIICEYQYETITSKTVAKLVCLGFSTLDKVTFENVDNGYTQFIGVQLHNFNSLNLEVEIDKTNKSIVSKSLNFYEGHSSRYTFYRNFDTSGDKEKTKSFSNFDITGNAFSESELSMINKGLNKLDFDNKFTLTFNENIFKNDENFKEICVNPGTKIAITNNHFLNEEDTEDYDYIWFPYNLMNFKFQNYFTRYETHIKTITDNGYVFSNWFGSKKLIDNLDPTQKQYLISRGYTSLYNYFGYNAVYFQTYYDKTDYGFYVFDFTDLTKIYRDSSSGTVHGGGGSRLDDDFNPIEDTYDYCFYINKRFDVYELKENEWGDIYGDDVKFNGDTIDVSSTDNMSKVDTKGLFSKVVLFIDEIRPTINFINNNIYSFYNSLPLLLKLFIISAFSLIMIKLIITMIVK